MEKEQIARRSPVTMPNTASAMPVKWENKARSVANDDNIIQKFVNHVAQRLLAQDPTSNFVVHLCTEFETDGHYLALLVHYTSLNAVVVEELLDNAAAEAMETYGIPSMPIVAAME